MSSKYKLGWHAYQENCFANRVLMKNMSSSR